MHAGRHEEASGNEPKEEAQRKTMDLATFTQHETAEYELETPAGEATGVRFLLAGPNHPARKARDRKVLARGLREFNRAGKRKLDEDPDEIVAQHTDFLVTCVLGWSALEIDGKPVAYSGEAARELFEDPRFEWVRGQVTGALNDLTRFISGSPRP